ncbi:MAG: alpha-N-arabinofuranosidase [Oscillospiraceae bacterium]|jgi:alpha-N-arabinofuranosidase|nr:alpha-N-arabinofuranosidase [Oscillospiraceae bacterium]
MTKLIISEKTKQSRIAPEIYGHFSEHLGRCIYEGVYVGENSEIPNVNGMRADVVNALRELKIPVLRWPGGCFADEYHWKDGIGPAGLRKKMINTHWGGVIEDNSFGTHEFFEFCRQLGCKTYVNGNMGSGAVREMSEWIEYITFGGVSPMADLRRKNGREEPWQLDYFGVGNENWGCGGNMLPQYYGNKYRQYQTYLRHYGQKEPFQKVCCGANADDADWTRGVLETTFKRCPDFLHGFMDGLSLHYYVHPGGWENKGSATEFDKNIWYQSLRKALYMDALINMHAAIMDEFDPEKRIAMVVDEWGAWYDAEPGTNPGFLYQQNTVRDALIAAVTLNIFNKRSDRVRMACLAQMVNVLQSVLLTEGSKMLKTPTYHVMRMYRHHQGARLLASRLEGNPEAGGGENTVPKLSESVSMDAEGVITVTLGNLSCESGETVEILTDEPGWSVSEAKIVAAADFHSYNDFANSDRVSELDFSGCEYSAKGLAANLAKSSVVMLRLQKK